MNAGRRAVGALGVTAWAVGVLAGCASDPRRGYAFRSATPDGVRTVAVPVFENSTFDAGVEAALTEAVIKELQRTPGLRVVQGGGADTTLRAIVTSSEMRRLSTQSSTGLTQELGVTLKVDFDWRDNRSGKVLVSRRDFAAADTFVPARPSNERLETGRNGAIQRLAVDLVAELRSTW
jgi:hypothetical protein